MMGSELVHSKRDSEPKEEKLGKSRPNPSGFDKGPMQDWLVANAGNNSGVQVVSLSSSSEQMGIRFMVVVVSSVVSGRGNNQFKHCKNPTKKYFSKYRVQHFIIWAYPRLLKC